MQNRQVCGVLLVGGIMWSIGGVAACSAASKSPALQTTTQQSSGTSKGAIGTPIGNKPSANSVAGEKLLRDGIAQSLITDQRGNVVGFIPKDNSRPKNFPEGDAAFDWVRYDHQGRPTEWKLVDAEKPVRAAW